MIPGRRHRPADAADAHQLHLSDAIESRARSGFDFLASAWRRGDAMLAIVRPAHWAAITALLRSNGHDVDEAIGSHRLVVLDAAAAVRAMTSGATLDPARFNQVFDDTLHRLCAARPQGGLSVYGEAVDVLAEQGEFEAAEHLERLWNASSRAAGMRVFCAYSAAHFAPVANRPHLAAICALHARVHAGEGDPLAAWLLGATPAPD